MINCRYFCVVDKPFNRLRKSKLVRIGSVCRRQFSMCVKTLYSQHSLSRNQISWLSRYIKVKLSEYMNANFYVEVSNPLTSLISNFLRYIFGLQSYISYSIYLVWCFCQGSYTWLTELTSYFLFYNLVDFPTFCQ